MCVDHHIMNLKVVATIWQFASSHEDLEPIGLVQLIHTSAKRSLWLTLSYDGSIEIAEDKVQAKMNYVIKLNVLMRQRL